MTIVKRSSLAIISVLFMLSVVGYINYKYNPQREQNLGQTVYVNGKDSFTYDNVSIYEEQKEVTTINPIKQEEDVIAVFKYDRDNMYSELSENYAKIISNASSSNEQVVEYQKKLDALIHEKNLITMVENVIKSKGFENIVIIPTSQEHMNVIIKSEKELEESVVAQIQQIIVDQLGTDANKISITIK